PRAPRALHSFPTRRSSDLRLGARGSLLLAELHLPAHLGEHGEDQLLLGLEVVVDEPLGDAGLLGDLLDRGVLVALAGEDGESGLDRKSTRLNSSHDQISYA